MKDKIIKFRLTSDELNLIKEKSQNLNMTLSGYVLKSALEKDIIVIPEIREFRTDLRRIGNNINQLTILAHTGQAHFFNLDETSKELGEIWRSLNSLRKSLHHKSH